MGKGESQRRCLYQGLFEGIECLLCLFRPLEFYELFGEPSKRFGYCSKISDEFPVVRSKAKECPDISEATRRGPLSDGVKFFREWFNALGTDQMSQKLDLGPEKFTFGGLHFQLNLLQPVKDLPDSFQKFLGYDQTLQYRLNNIDKWSTNGL